MSDIYLQITETPTVVTLSAPVISGALSSTVTVANVVTVALDSNSLSALENVTVTVGAAITGTVTVSNFPATQPVSIASVTVGNTVTIAGTVTANPTGTQTIAGTVTANINTFPDATTLGEQIAQGFTNYGSFEVVVGGTSNISGTVTANALGTRTFVDGNAVTVNGFLGVGGWDSVNSQHAPIPLTDSGTGVRVGFDDITGSPFQVINHPSIPLSATVTVGSLPAISGTVNASLASENDFVVIGEEIAQGINNQGTIPISGTVTANVFGFSNSENAPKKLLTDADGVLYITPNAAFLSIGGTVTANLGSALPAGTNRIGVVTIGGGTVTIGAGTAQIGSVTASISGTVPVSGTFFQATQPVSLTTLPALVSGTAQIGSVTASISNSVTIASLPAISGTVTANTFALQGTAVTTSNFTSTTASTVLASFNATREVLTIFNEGAGNLHICAGATCTTIAYQVRLSAGDYYEVPNHQTTITHSAVFATAGTARVTQVS